MNEVWRQFINQWQGNFPLAELPFALVSDELGIESADLIALIRDLLD